jgi:chromate reductase, NAD(P)H dehydrogenase (quinone)
VRVLGLSGSLRSGSYNTSLLRAAGRLLPPPADLEIYTDLAAVPPYSEDLDLERTHPAVEQLRHAIASADALLIATPEYNASIPGHLKNALDWVSRPFPDNALRRKPVAVIGASTGLFGAVWAQAELRKVLTTLGAAVLDAEVAVPAAHAAFTDDGRLRDPRLATALQTTVDELAANQASRAA